MRLVGLPYAILVIFVGITSILGFDEQDVILFSKSSRRNPTDEKTIPSFSKPTYHIPDKFDSSNIKTLKYGRLSPYDFSFTIADLLTPDIFTQDDPLRFLIDKILTVQVNASWTMSELNYFLTKNKFPSQYVPYAKALRSLLRIQAELDNLDWNIKKYIRRSRPANSPDDYFQLPEQFQTPELSELFSFELFSDENPTLRILNLVLNTPETEIPYVTLQLMNLSQYDRLPRQYQSYIKPLLSLMRNNYARGFLKTDIAKMRRVAALNASKAEYDSNDNTQENIAKTNVAS